MGFARFKNKRVVVTGAGSGMGREAAIRLALEGASVVAVGRRLAPLTSLCEEIRDQQGCAEAIACDISDVESLAAMVGRLRSAYGQIDALFANAGVLGEFKPLADCGDAQFDEVIATNLMGTFNSISQCLPLMTEGAILINASWTAGSVMPGVGAYAATKGALLSLMRTFAVELGPRGIRVNAINPGIILTPMADAALDPTMAERLALHTPLRRNGTPEDVAGTVAWLLSEDAAFVTGQEITVDGGFTLGGALRA